MLKVSPAPQAVSQCFVLKAGRIRTFLPSIGEFLSDYFRFM